MDAERDELPVAAGPGLGFALNFVDGRAVLVLERRPLEPFGRLDRLEMEIPGLRFPFDFSGGMSRFQNRRCRLREIGLSAGPTEIASLLPPSRLAEMGIRELQLQISDGIVRFDGRIGLGGREAGFTARAAVVPAASGRVRVTAYDVRAYGFVPVPAPMIATAVFVALGGRERDGKAERPLLALVGPGDLEIEAVDLGLLGVLASSGWRLPERRELRPAAAHVPAGRVAVRFVGADVVAGATAGPEGWLEHEEGRTRNMAGEAALLRGDWAAAVDAYRRAAPVTVGDRFATARLLALLTSSTETLAEADEVARAAQARWPDLVAAQLARAVVASEAGRGDEAAALYERLATETDPSDRAWALVAAARERGTSRPAEALVLLERARAVLPGHRGAARALGMRLAGDARWSDLVRLLVSQAAEEPDPAEKSVAHARAGRIYLDRLKDPPRARDRFEQAVRLAQHEPAGWEGLGRARAASKDWDGARTSLAQANALYAGRGDRVGQARVDLALATLDEAAGRDDAALARLHEAATLDPTASEPLRRAAEISTRIGRLQEAARLLEGAIARTDRPEERRPLLRQLAKLYAGALSEPVAARLLIEQALAETPSDLVLLDELGSLLDRQAESVEWEPFLRRALVHAPNPELNRALLERLRDWARKTGDVDARAEALRALVVGSSPERNQAAMELTELVGELDEPVRSGMAADALEALLTQPSSFDDPLRPELARRLASLRERQGNDEAALAWLRVCLEGNASGTVAVAAWRRFVEIAARRGDAVAAAQSLVAWADDLRTGEEDKDRSAHLAAAAALFRDRLGLVADARALLERAVNLDPQNMSAFDKLEALAAEMEDFERVAEVVARRIQGARPGQQKPLMHRLAVVLLRALGKRDEALEVYGRILALDPKDPEALAARAAHLWEAGQHAESLILYRRLVEPDVESAPAVALAEAHLRLASVAHAEGKSAQARTHLERALAHEPQAGAPVPVLLATPEVFGRPELLLAVLARREEATSDPEARREIVRARAGLLEDDGRGEEAASILRPLLEDQPHDIELLTRVAHLMRGPGRLPFLERLWQIVEEGNTVGLDAERIGLDLAETWREANAPDRAEAVLGMVLGHAPQAAAAYDALDLLLVRRGAFDEAGVLLKRRAGIEADAAAAARVLVEGARRRLAAHDGARAAWSILEGVPLEALSPEGLSLRAEIAERTGAQAEAIAAWQALLARGVRLGDEIRARIHLVLAETAEREANFDRALDEYERALALDADSRTRARQLLGRARVLVQRKEIDAAIGDLDEALALVADHAEALALRAEIAFRNQDWEEARRVYARLASAPDADQAITPSLLAFRRATLAEMFGDEQEAEAAYREAADLDPAQLEAREALAQIAVYRGELPEAARRLDEVLALLPTDAVERSRDVRQRLGEIRFQLQDYPGARSSLEAVLSESPDREGALESLVAVYERLGLHREAADVCERLARVCKDSTRRAEALFRQGEILRVGVGDAAAANDAYLRSSDLDPTYVPTLLRLAEYYWAAGDLRNVGEIGAELSKTQSAASLGESGVGLVISLVAACDGDTQLARSSLDPASMDANQVATRLGELAQALGRRGPENLDPALDMLFEAIPGAFDRALADALMAQATERPSSVGLLLALARVAERVDRVPTAFGAYALVRFFDPRIPLDRRIEELGAVKPRSSAWSAGAVDHRACRGPLRRALRALSAPLAGSPGAMSRQPGAAEAPRPVVAMVEELRARLDAPPVQVAGGGSGVEVEVVGTAPITLIAGGRLGTAAPAELSFRVARALDDARTGTWLARALGDKLWDLLQAIAAEGARAEAIKAVPAGEARTELLQDLKEALADRPSLDSYLEGCSLTADRVGVMACGDPLAALHIIADGTIRADEPLPARVREVAMFLISSEYRAHLGRS